MKLLFSSLLLIDFIAPHTMAYRTEWAGHGMRPRWGRKANETENRAGRISISGTLVFTAMRPPFCGAAAFAVQRKEQRPPQEAPQKIGRINSYRYPADRRNSTQKKMVTTLMREEKITPLAERVSSAPNSRAIT